MKFVPELLIALKTKDIAKLIEIYKDSTLQALYASYNADFQHDEQSQHYVLVASTSSSNLVKKEYAEEFVLNELFSFLQGFDLSPYIESATKSLLSFELEPVYKEVERIENQIELGKKRMNTVIDLMDDPTACLDKELLKSKLLSHQEELNKNNIVLEELTKQINFKKVIHPRMLLLFVSKDLVIFMKYFLTKRENYC